MKNSDQKNLLPYQEQFIENFVRRPVSRTLLIAPPGTGKTISAITAMSRVLSSGDVQRVLVVTPTRMLVDQWRSLADSSSFWTAEGVGPNREAQLAVVTLAAADRPKARQWEGVPPGTRWLFVFDEVTWQSGRLENFAADAMRRYPGSRALFVAGYPATLEVDERFAFESEFFAREVLEQPPTRQNVQLLAPSFGLLQKVQRDLAQIDGLSWRRFEELIAEILERDGYQVDLMQGTKDGGVDVVAIKDLGNAGLFKSVWQAKKNRIDRKIGLSLVRELADTRLQHGASKAIIVTTSYLTSGALERVERDRYWLGKVDRDDLGAWIARTLRRD